MFLGNLLRNATHGFLVSWIEDYPVFKYIICSVQSWNKTLYLFVLMFPCIVVLAFGLWCCPSTGLHFPWKELNLLQVWTIPPNTTTYYKAAPAYRRRHAPRRRSGWQVTYDIPSSVQLFSFIPCLSDERHKDTSVGTSTAIGAEPITINCRRVRVIDLWVPRS